MNFENEFINCKVKFINNNKREIKITGKVVTGEIYNNVTLFAANPVDNITSYSGSGLPFPNSDYAFDNTKNRHLIDNSGFFDVVFTYPNSYYINGGRTKLISSLFFIFENHDGSKKFIRFELKDLFPLKTLNNREARVGPEFYDAKYTLLPIDTAYEVMKEYKNMKVKNDIG
jgi:hypothetical protein